MNNISSVKDCYGCGVCATICAKDIISIEINEDGFYTPVIKELDKCTNCGLCREVCSFLDNEISLKSPNLTTYAGWSKSHEVRRRCSSGGVGFEVGKTLINEGYKACGVRYNIEKGIAEHYISETVEDFIPSIGSKYIQSYTLNAFRLIDRKQKYLVTGTPCQIDSFRRYIQKFKKEENFVLLDFFCHGVPSKFMWDKYVKSAEKKIGKLSYVSWRNKFEYGWHNSWLMALIGSDNKNQTDNNEISLVEKRGDIESLWTQGDIFYNLFLENVCLGKACYHNCKYKYKSSSADIRIGDAWGSIYEDNTEGVSIAIAFTNRGKDVLLRTNCEFKEHTLEEIAEGQIKDCVKKAPQYKMVMSLLKNDDTTIEEIFIRHRKDQNRRRIIRIITNPIKSCKNLLSRFKRKKRL